MQASSPRKGPQIIQPSRREFADFVSSEIHKQLKPFEDELETKDK